MNIRLKNIGIIQDSTIEIKGLTVITGQNNSGKTTVGKVIYSLIDSVSDLYEKSDSDRFNYAISKIQKASEEFPFRIYMRRGSEQIESECLRIFFTGNYKKVISKSRVELYLMDLITELSYFDIQDDPYIDIIDKYCPPMRLINGEMFKNFEEQKTRIMAILDETLNDITSDPDLLNYTRQCVNATLLTEFYGQIQPVAKSNESSFIKVTNNNETCFKIRIEDNLIKDNGDSIYWSTPYKKAFFIDNPFVLNEPLFYDETKYTVDEISYLNESRIVTHDNRLKVVLNDTEPKSVFEAGIIDEHYKAVKQKIDEVLPGDFMVSDGEQYYVNNGVKLKTANLATGSKIFSIIKMLLEKGEIDKNTLLILDEPESHLHPKWQNAFVEIMVLLIKEIGCHILLTTHSSHFMLAVDAYMRKYEIMDMCNFYQTENIEDSMFVKYNCVNDSLDLIYKDFVSYLSDVKMIRSELMRNEWGE